ncbi:MAG: dihydroxy-acid dehydratase [Candidatus Abyssobacteria bacterium SURF_5]|uniref:Dihydroxy-acid dehydratase n=1 Tax=Abyssobacteria bacterium (strain SURF_5) TaxID=2093360 RepID=A0A3A4NBI8_ABYX5|nr:MAG: dihydroxy-acid dehydratase [Candidatus Abyssubacteria bacterium SURF_5]
MVKKRQSSVLLENVDRTATALVRRELLKCIGLTEEEMKRPLVGVVNSWTELTPGHLHLREVAEAVKAGVRIGGGTPLEFNTPAPCDGYGNGLDGMKYVLPLRDLIADSVETMVLAHHLDALVFISSCDKIVPAHLLAAARLDLPSVFVTGGPMLPFDLFLPKDAPRILSQLVCPSSGACPGMGTANTMQFLVEALGMSLPASATTHAVQSEKIVQAKQSGMLVMKALEAGLSPRAVMTRQALENAVSVQMASGGSTNAVLHVLALADELGIEFDISEYNLFSQRVPHICGGLPSGPYSILDIHKAGGVPAIMIQLGDLIHGDALTVTGRTVADNLVGKWALDEEVIRPRSNPFHAEGGIAILRGNLAPDSAVVKQSGVPESMLVFRGPARIFENEAESVEAALNRVFQPGEVIVIRNEGPRGGPGMREILTVTEQLFQMGLEEQVAIITDARFSGFTRGPAIGHVCPEAYEGGPLAAVRNGDFIKIDIPARTVDVEISREEMDKRLRQWKRPERNLKGYLAKYAALVSPAYRGAVVKV